MQEISCWIIGGGCYGAGYVKQFRKATARGKMPAARWIVLDQNSDCKAEQERQPGDPLEVRVGDWADLLAAAIAAGELKPGDQIIPSPFQGPLISRWLTLEAAAVGRSLKPVVLPELGRGLRYEQIADDQAVRYVSFAGWTCPVHCIEPPKCPAIRGPKDWDLRETVADFAVSEGFGEPLAFTCLHWLYGVGATPGSTFLEARRRMREAPPGRFLVASLSTCHGAISGWELT